MNITILKFDSLTSTNTEAIEQAKRGAEEGVCIVAGYQTAGRGRHGRTWDSPKNSGLYFSIILRPKLEMKFLPLITLATSVAVFDLLENLYRLRPDIKWSNDVLVNERKISGILAETTETDKGLAVIVGIGINLNSANISAELAPAATAIYEETGITPDIDELLRALTKFLTYFYGILEDPDGPKKILEHWKRRSTYFEGKNVRVTQQGEIFDGTTRGLEENGALRIETRSGEIKIIQAGDVDASHMTGSWAGAMGHTQF
ncbi:MAG: biotin--[acetyl-CoA-carboxylase] ligase, partial [Acidobacteria bacterium]|nr:biotin--[acetyl-CoA-carboxylase] ligase [Acidobacteriota bacterium]